MDGKEIDIYLYLKDDKKYIPAPKYYWKVIQNGITGEAIAFIGLNDPHSEDILADEGFCNSVCSDISGYGKNLTCSLSNRHTKPHIGVSISRKPMVGFEGLWAHNNF